MSDEYGDVWAQLYEGIECYSIVDIKDRGRALAALKSLRNTVTLDELDQWAHTATDHGGDIAYCDLKAWMNARRAKPESST